MVNISVVVYDVVVIQLASFLSPASQTFQFNSVVIQDVYEQTDLYQAALAENANEIRHPCGDILRRRQENMKHGIPVEPSIWEQVLQI